MGGFPEYSAVRRHHIHAESFVDILGNAKIRITAADSTGASLTFRVNVDIDHGAGGSVVSGTPKQYSPGSLRNSGQSRHSRFSNVTEGQILARDAGWSSLRYNPLDIWKESIN